LRVKRELKYTLLLVRKVMKNILTTLCFLFIVSCLCWFFFEAGKAQPVIRLPFKLPSDSQSELKIRTVQAELCRLGIFCTIDGKYGEQTAKAVIDLLRNHEKEK